MPCMKGRHFVIEGLNGIDLEWVRFYLFKSGAFENIPDHVEPEEKWRVYPTVNVITDDMVEVILHEAPFVKANKPSGVFQEKFMITVDAEDANGINLKILKVGDW